MDGWNVHDVIDSLSHDEFGDFLSERGLHEDVVSLFVAQRVSGAAFLKISEDDLKELIPIIGDRILVRELLRECYQVLGNISRHVLSYKHLIITRIHNNEICMILITE